MTRTSISLKRKTKTTDAAVILAPFLDFAEKGEADLFDYMRHCGIQLETLEANDARTAEDLILAHYRLPTGNYDIDLCARDLARWPSIAARIHELRESAKFESDLKNALTTSRKISGKRQQAH